MHVMFKLYIKYLSKDVNKTLNEVTAQIIYSNVSTFHYTRFAI